MNPYLSQFMKMFGLEIPVFIPVFITAILCYFSTLGWMIENMAHYVRGEPVWHSGDVGCHCSLSGVWVKYFDGVW